MANYRYFYAEGVPSLMYVCDDLTRDP